MGRRARRPRWRAVGRGHARARVLDLQGACCDDAGARAVAWLARLRRARGELLARVRSGRQGGRHGPPAARPRGRAAGGRRAAGSPAARRLRRRPGGRHRPPAAALAAGDAPRLPRREPRLVRGRADAPYRSARRTLGRFFAEEIAAPLGLEVYFGAPEDFPRERLARIERDPPLGRCRGCASCRGRWRCHAEPALARVPHVRQPRLRWPADLDRAEYRSLEFPAGGAIGSARDIARAYAAFVAEPRELGLTEATLDELTRYPGRPVARWHDEVLKVDTAFSLGFARPHGEFRFGSSDRAFGHPARAAPSRSASGPRVAFAYVMNRMGFRLNDDPREKALRDALYRCLA